MKRTVTLLLSIVLLLALTACNGAGEKPSVDLDRNFAQEFAFCETEDAVYFSVWMGDRMILYADKESGIGGPLCAKPECQHNSASCNAYIDKVHLFGIGNYDGKLYFESGDDICRADYDGTNRERVRPVDKKLRNEINFYNVLYHRDYAFFVGETSDIVDGTPQYGCLAYALSLTDPEAEPVIIFREAVGANRGLNVDYDLRGNELYVFMYSWGVDYENDVHIPDSGALYIARWNMETREAEVVFDAPFAFAPYGYWALEDTILMTGEDYVWELDMQTGSLAKRFTFDEEQQGSYFMADNKVVSLIGANWSEKEGSFCVKDFDGNTVASGPLQVPDIGGQEGFFLTRSFLGADDVALYVQYDLLVSGSDTLTRLVQIPLDGSGQRVIAEYDDYR